MTSPNGFPAALTEATGMFPVAAEVIDLPEHDRVRLGSEPIEALSRHCIATLLTEQTAKLMNMGGFVSHVSGVLETEGVQCVGQIAHEFDNESFTSVFALSESHLSVHTWPERGAVQLDVFLCNYVRDNREKCERIYRSIVDYFEPEQVEETFVDRF